MPLDLYAAFVLATVVLIALPGPNVALIVANSVAHGRGYGLLTVAGTTAAMVPQLVLTVAGMTGALTLLSHVFEWVRWAGVAYLVYLGIQALRAPAVDLTRVRPEPKRPRDILLRGFLVSLTNPKTLLFYGAFLPQFVDPGAANKALAFLFLGFVFNVNGTLWNLFVAWSAARVASRLNGSGRFALWLNRTVGALFLYLGLKLVMSYER